MQRIGFLSRPLSCSPAAHLPPAKRIPAAGYDCSESVVGCASAHSPLVCRSGKAVGTENVLGAAHAPRRPFFLCSLCTLRCAEPTQSAGPASTNANIGCASHSSTQFSYSSKADENVRSSHFIQNKHGGYLGLRPSPPKAPVAFAAEHSTSAAVGVSQFASASCRCDRPVACGSIKEHIQYHVYMKFSGFPPCACVVDVPCCVTPRSHHTAYIRHPNTQKFCERGSPETPWLLDGTDACPSIVESKRDRFNISSN